MYFKSRQAAGQLLAAQIAKKYAGEPCAILALDDGGVVVGMQIALKLRAALNLLLSQTIDLPREPTPIAGITSDGAFSYNHAYSDGEIDELVMEYHSYIDQQKMTNLHTMRQLAGNAQLVRRELLEDKNIIIVSEGMPDGFSLDLALEFLKPIRHKKVIVATPLASVPAVDRIHILADGIFCLNVVTEYMNTDHYYDAADVPSHDRVVAIVERVIASWR